MSSLRCQTAYGYLIHVLFSFRSYCTPGFVMGMNAYLNNTSPEQRTLVDIENLFDGHCKYSYTTLTIANILMLLYTY